jgi:proline racemase
MTAPEVGATAWGSVIRTIDSHTDGNPTRVVVEGVEPIPGATLLEKREHLRRHRDELRRFLVHEPRGGGLLCALLVLDAIDPAADVSVLLLEQDEYPPMCGHCMIGLATTLVDTGRIPRAVPDTTITVETPAGLVRTVLHSIDGRTDSVTLVNVPAYVARQGLKVALPEGQVASVDIAYGGEYYACVQASEVGVEIRPEHGAHIIRVAAGVRKAMATLRVPHPTRPVIDRVYNVLFYEDMGGDPRQTQNVVVCPPGAIDRSPCGTGTSALLARLHAQGELAAGGILRNAGILGTAFVGRIKEETREGDLPAVVTEVTGRAYITGFHEFVLDSQDPFPAGYVIGG